MRLPALFLNQLIIDLLVQLYQFHIRSQSQVNVLRVQVLILRPVPCFEAHVGDRVILTPDDTCRHLVVLALHRFAYHARHPLDTPTELDSEAAIRLVTHLAAEARIAEGVGD